MAPTEGRVTKPECNARNKINSIILILSDCNVQQVLSCGLY